MKDTLIAGPLPATVLALTLKEYSVEGIKSDTSSEVYASETVVTICIFRLVPGPSTCML